MINYNRSSLHEKWTLMKYFNDFEMLTLYASAIRSNTSISDSGIESLMTKMIEEGKYKPREKLSIDTGKFKTIQVAWYMFGFYEKGRKANKKFVFSPLGNLLLDFLGDHDSVAKIFTSMLFGNPFRNPFSRMSSEFNIYPFRLLFKLLLDDRLNRQLYNDEIFYLVMFMKTCTDIEYDSLINDILELRALKTDDKLLLFKKDESVLANAIHEWRYTSKLLEGANILEITEGNRIGSLIQGNNTGSRAYRTDYVSLNPAIVPFVVEMLDSFSYSELPYTKEEIQSKFSDDYWISFYNFYPKLLLDELGISHEEDNKELLEIVSGITTYSMNMNDGDPDRFEKALESSFNLFIDVDAKQIGGPSNTDVECLYTYNTGMKTFAIEAKSTRNKLNLVNTSRLKSHRIKIGAEYTLLVTSNYTPGVVSDIRNNEIVLLKSSILSNYLYQSIKFKGRDLTYKFLDELITSNLGKDISYELKNYIFDEFGVGVK